MPALAPPKLRQNAWLILGLCVIGVMCCSTSVMLVNVSLFIKPLSESHGWSRGAVVLALSVASFAQAIVNPFIGRAIDRFGVKIMLIASLTGYAAATASLPFLIDRLGLAGLYVGYALVAMLGAGSNIIAYVRVLSGWFSGPMNQHRGLALGVAAAGVTLGMAVSAPVAVELIHRAGWHGAYYGLTVFPLLVGLPIAVFGMRMAPDDMADGLDKDSTREPSAGLTLGEAARTRAFWLMLGIALLMSSNLQGVMVHMPALVSDLGLPADGLAVLVGATGMLGIFGKVFAGFLFDRFFAPYVSVWIFGIAVVGSFAMAAFDNLIVAVVVTLLQVVGAGAEIDLISYVAGRYFGIKAYAQIFGCIYSVYMVGIALGPFLVGLSFDHWGGYQIAFLISGAGLCAACLLLLLLPRYPSAFTNI